MAWRINENMSASGVSENSNETLSKASSWLMQLGYRLRIV
jgi:hypothetical protein